MVAVVPCDVASKATRFTFPALSGLVMAASAPGWFWMVMVNCLVLAMGIPPACMADYKAAISNWHLAIGKSKTFNAEETEEPEEIEWPRMERTASGNWQLAVGKSKTNNSRLGHRFAQMGADERRVAANGNNSKWQLAISKTKTFNTEETEEVEPAYEREKTRIEKKRE